MKVGDTVWDRTLEMERVYGDKAEALVATLIRAAEMRGDAEEAACWKQVSADLRQLHQIGREPNALPAALLGWRETHRPRRTSGGLSHLDFRNNGIAKRSPPRDLAAQARHPSRAKKSL